MRVQEAILILEKLKRSSQDIIPIQPTANYPHTPEKVLRQKDSDRIIVMYVKRLEYMAWLKSKFNLIDKRGNLKDALRRT